MSDSMWSAMDGLFDFELKSAVQPYKIKAEQAEADAKASLSKYYSNQLKYQIEDRDYRMQKQREADEAQHKYDKVKDVLAMSQLINELKSELKKIEQEDNYSTDPQYIAVKAQFDALSAVI